jgi:aldehyde dehydrogenase (NAD+)
MELPAQLASRKIGPALAAGNTVVFKPSPMTPLMGERLAAAFVDCRTAVRCAQRRARDGGRGTPREQLRRRCRHLHGSNVTGQKIHAAIGIGRRVQLELGGKNPIVVLADADLDAGRGRSSPARASR